MRTGQDIKPGVNGGLASIPVVQSGYNMAHGSSQGLGSNSLASQQAYMQQQVGLTDHCSPPLL